MAGEPQYFRQLEEARRVALALSAAQAEVLFRILQDYVSELAARVEVGIATGAEEQALRIAREVVRDLARDLAFATGRGVRITADRVAEIHARATLGLLEANGASAGLAVGMSGIGVRAAQAVLARPQLARAFRTIQREAIDAVDQILTRGIARGVSARQIEMQLRMHMLGAESIPARLLQDRRFIGLRTLRELGFSDPTAADVARMRAEAGRVSMRARLIARHEIMTAEHEARVQAQADSPVVESVRWRLSGRHPEEDICVPPGTLITTRDGPRPVEQLGLGDQVLTHRGRWRPVTQLYQRTIPRGQLVRLRCRSGRSHRLDLELTPNHPVLTDRGWRRAGDLQMDMRVAIGPESPPAPGYQLHHDRKGTAQRDSAESETSPPMERAALRRCGAPELAIHHTTHILGLDSHAPIGSSPYETGKGRPPRPHLSNSDCSLLAARATTGLGVPPAWSTSLGAVCQNWGSGYPTCRHNPWSTIVYFRGTRRHTSRSAWGPASGNRLSRRALSRLAPGSESPTAQRRNRRRSRQRAFSDLPTCTPGCNISPCRSCEGAHGRADCRWRISSPYLQDVYQRARMQWSTIESLSLRRVQGQLVHNLGVRDDHSYVAGGIVVHNCDDLASADFYGLGSGRYPPEAVPGRPHPRCLCYSTSELLPVERWGEERDVPGRTLDPAEVAEGEGRSPSQVRALERAFRVGEARIRRAA